MGILGDLKDGLNSGLKAGGDLIDAGKKKLGEGVDYVSDKAGDYLDEVGLDKVGDVVHSVGDHIAAGLGATPTEQGLGHTDDPTQLVHGNPGKIRESAKHLTDFHTAFDHVGQGMKKVHSSGWTGEGGDAFRRKFKMHPTKWLHAADACADAGKALDAYADAIKSAQDKAQDAIDLWKKAEHTSKTAVDAYNKKVDAYNTKIKADQDPGPKPDPFHDPGDGQRKEAENLLADARRIRNEAARTADSAIKKALAHAPAEPPPLTQIGNDLGDGLKAVDTELTHVVGGVIKGGAGLVNFARGLNPTDPYNLTHPAAYYQNVNMTLAGLVSTGTHPERIVTAAVDGFKNDPSEFTGRLIPELIGTKGAGLAKSGLRMGIRTGEKAALREGAESAAGREARRSVEKEPTAHDESSENRAHDDNTDPVDLVTGRMYLAQADITLPGTLPLVFTRRVESASRLGRWFGPSWTSTIDQRLEIDEAGVIFVTEDGLLLNYPHPAPGVPTLPASGSRRWPLDRVDEGYTITDPHAGQVWHFADRGEQLAILEQIDDRNGNWITFVYDTEGTPLSITSSSGYHLKITSDGSRVTALHLAGAAPDGSDQEIRRYSYSSAGDLTQIFNSSGQPLQFTYDDRGRVTSWTDANDRSYAYEYDDQDRCIAQGGSDGHMVLSLSYSDTDAATGYRLTSTTTGEGHTRRYLINTDNQIVAETNPLGHTTRFTRDRYNRLLSRTDPLGHTTLYGYDDNAVLTSVVRPDGRGLTAEYGEFGMPTRVRGTDGGTTRHAYDARGNRTSTTSPSGQTTHFAHDEAGRLTSVTDPLGHVTTVRCDQAGLPVELTDPLGAVTRYQRDAFGRPVSATDPTGATTRLEWTPEGHLARRVAPDGTSETWVYDGEGNCTTHTDPVGGVTRFEYTHFDLLAARTTPDGVRYEFAYDAELRLTQVTNPQGLTWAYGYDSTGALISETDFDDRTLTYAYDAAGNLTSRTNALGQSTAFERDALGRITRKDAAGQVTTYAYDLTDQLAEATGPDGTRLSILRDQYGRVRSETVDGRELAYDYDQLGRPIGRITPAGARSTWVYDAAGRRTDWITSGRSIGIGYDAAGRELTRDVADFATLENTYDPLGRLFSQAVTSADSRPLQHRTYTYRADGNLTALDDLLNGTSTFDIDPAGRITAVHAASWSETYAYDAAGNQASATWPATHPGHEATGERAYTGTRITRAGGVRYEHDALGRTILRQKTRLSRKPDTWRYAWDAEDRLTQVTTPDGTVWRYCYDPLGRRTAKLRLEADGATVAERVTFTWDGTILCEQTTHASELPNPVTLTWDHQNLQPIAQTERITSTASGTSQEEIDSRFFAIVTDLVGTPRELVGEDGEIAWRTRSTLWGTTTWNVDASTYTPLRFPGQYYDPESGLHHNYFRYYDPEASRYLSSDPLGLAPAPNPATYVHNPTTWADPLGLYPRCLNQTGKEGKTADEDYISGSAEGQKLADRLRGESANSLFNENGWLTPEAIAESRRVIPGDRLGNQVVRDLMVQDGSKLSDWGKYTTRTHQSPYGDFQVHYYYNPETGRVLNYDYKVIMNRRPQN